jgi:hypothetical protein
MKRGRASEPQASQKKARPSSVKAWNPVHVADYLRACDPRTNAKVAAAIEQEGISGRTAMKLTEDDLGSMTKSLGERKSAFQAIQNLKHPLMPAFIQMDTDDSNTITANELAHVLTRVKGRCVTESEASSIIAKADVDQSGDVDFQEFKDILESDGATDWAAAAEAVGAPKALLNAGMAFRTQSDQMMAPTHTALRSGSVQVRQTNALNGLGIPSPAMRMFVVDGLASIPAGLITSFTASLAVWWQLLCLFPRGQNLNMWICGTQYRDLVTGHPCSWCATFMRQGAQAFALAALWLLSFWIIIASLFSDNLHDESAWIAAASLSFLSLPILEIVGMIMAFQDPMHRNLYDRMCGVVMVYKPPDVATVIYVHSS